VYLSKLLSDSMDILYMSKLVFMFMLNTYCL